MEKHTKAGSENRQEETTTKQNWKPGMNHKTTNTEHGKPSPQEKQC